MCTSQPPSHFQKQKWEFSAATKYCDKIYDLVNTPLLSDGDLIDSDDIVIGLCSIVKLHQAS